MLEIQSIGIIGGGQLGMMLLESDSAAGSGLKHLILSPEKDCPAEPYADELILGSLNQASDIRKLADRSDVITWEIEHIDVDTLLQLELEGKRVIPFPRVLKLIQDKGLQKLYFQENGIPTAPFYLKNEEEAWNLDVFSGDQVVLKSRTGGYDGKGVAIVNKDVLLAGNSPFSGSILVEQFAQGVKELAVIVAVDIHGNMGCFPAIDMYFNPQSNLVEFLYSPSLLSKEILKQAQQIAERVVGSFESTGLFAVEMFLTQDGQLWVNEIAPRPHNSGHHSIEGFETSQFEQLYRILRGDVLGSFGMKTASAMINLVGPEGLVGSYELADEDLWNSQGDVFIHMYGKSETRPHRKLGHVTVIADTVEALLVRAKEVQAALRIIPS